MWSFQEGSNGIEYNEFDGNPEISVNLSNAFGLNEFNQMWPVKLLKCALVDLKKCWKLLSILEMFSQDAP